MECPSCGAIVVVRCEDEASKRTGWRDGAMAWNRWALKVRRVLAERGDHA